MRHFDFSPLYRATVGFDQIAEMMDRVLTSDNTGPSYPPYNIEKTADDAYRISVAVAGFSETDLNVEVKENALIVSAQKPEANEAATYLHRGIATRAFERRFQLADHVRVHGASYLMECCTLIWSANCQRPINRAGLKLHQQLHQRLWMQR